MKFRAGPNGTLIAPKRGPPPQAPDGYVPSKGDPYTFEPVLSLCEHRENRRRFLEGCIPCGRSNPFQIFCKIDNQYTLPQICKKCPHGYGNTPNEKDKH